MKKICEKFNVDSSFEDFKKDKANKLLKDKMLMKYLKENNFNSLDVYNDPFIFEDTLNSLKAYQKNNIDELDGYILGVKKDGDYYYSYRQASVELLEFFDKSKHLDNYVINHFENLYDLDFNDLEIENESINYIKLYNYLKNFNFEQTKKGLYICGDMGIGKSYLMVAFLNSLAKKNIKVAILKINEFISKYKSIELLSDRIELINNIKKVDILVFDDIGSEYSTNFTKDEILLPILDYRMNHQHLTFFTSNYNLDRLENVYALSNDKNDTVNAKRIIERIKTLAKIFFLDSNNKRHD